MTFTFSDVLYFTLVVGIPLGIIGVVFCALWRDKGDE
jgi:ABC-type antimicrobial peptide transport system permease subunit